MCIVVLPPGVNPISVNKYINSHGQIQEEYQQLELWWQLYGYTMSDLGHKKCLGTWYLLQRMYLISNYNHLLSHPVHCSLVILPLNTKLMKIYVVKLTTNKIINKTNLILRCTDFYHNIGYFLYNSLNISETVCGVMHHCFCPYSLLLWVKQPVQIKDQNINSNMDMYKIFYAIDISITSSTLLPHYCNSTCIWPNKQNTEFFTQTPLFPDLKYDHKQYSTGIFKISHAWIVNCYPQVRWLVCAMWYVLTPCSSHVTVQAVASCSKHTGNEHSLLFLGIATILPLKTLCALYERTQTLNTVKYRVVTLRWGTTREHLCLAYIWI